MKKWAGQFPDAAVALAAWLKNGDRAAWRNIAEVRRVYPHADPVEVESGRTVVVFNVRGNRYRLITAIHYNRQVIYTLRFMTHAEYSKDRWKDTL
ncbi:MAG: type II toxin-antitoxin system HigB family toxin [Pirellulales bacterium]